MSEDFWNDETVNEFVNLRIHDGNPFAETGLLNAVNDIRMRQFKLLKQNSNKDWEIIERVAKTKSINAILIGGDDAFDIKSVRRLSDNEVFSVGEHILYGAGENTETIKLFREDKYGLSVITNSVTLSFEHIKKAKQKLFTTLDGKDIYYGENCWVVSPETSFGWQPLKVLMNNTPLDERGKYFSTEAAAKDYIVLNSPCLSYSDIIKLAKIWYIGEGESNNRYGHIQTMELKKLVEEKINNGERQ